MLRVPPEPLATADTESIAPRIQRGRESKDNETGLRSTELGALSRDGSKQENSAVQATSPLRSGKCSGMSVLRRTLRRRQLRQPAQQLAPFRR